MDWEMRQTHRTRPRRRPRLAHFEDEDDDENDGVSDQDSELFRILNTES